MRPFHGVLGEDDSDAETLAILIRRLREARGLRPIRIKPFGYEGCAQLLRRGATQLTAWEKVGCVRAYVCHDADRGIPGRREAVSPEERTEIIQKQIIRASTVKIPCNAVVPVQEIEAWMLGDIANLGELFHWCRGLPQHVNPESINDPKEHIIRLSRNPQTGKTRYHPPTHNPVMAQSIDLGLLLQRCPSFVALAQFVGEE